MGRAQATACRANHSSGWTESPRVRTTRETLFHTCKHLRSQEKAPQLLTEEPAEGAHGPALSGGRPSLGGGEERCWQGSADFWTVPEIPTEEAVSSCAQDPSTLSCERRNRGCLLASYQVTDTSRPLRFPTSCGGPVSAAFTALEAESAAASLRSACLEPQQASPGQPCVSLSPWQVSGCSESTDGREGVQRMPS